MKEVKSANKSEKGYMGKDCRKIKITSKSKIVVDDGDVFVTEQDIKEEKKTVNKYIP